VTVELNLREAWTAASRATTRTRTTTRSGPVIVRACGRGRRFDEPHFLDVKRGFVEYEEISSITKLSSVGQHWSADRSLRITVWIVAFGWVWIGQWALTADAFPNARQWWLSFALPLALRSLIVGLPFGVAIAGVLRLILRRRHDPG
jgi:hypothetical protein